MTTAAELSTARALKAAEDSGFKISLSVYLAAVALAGAWLALAWPRDALPLALAPAAVLLAAGIAAYVAVGTRFDGALTRYALLGFDAVGLGALLVAGPVPRDAGAVAAFGPVAALLLLGLAAPLLSVRRTAWAAILALALCWLPMAGGVVPDGWAVPSVAVPAVASAVVLVAAGLIAWAVATLRRVVAERAAAGRMRGRIQAAFGRYMPADVVEDLVKVPGALDPVERDASILHVEVAGFPLAAQGQAPAEAIGALDAFFRRAAEIVAEGGGMIVEVFGETAMASFNLPLEINDHPDRALWVARALLHAARRETFGGMTLELRIGVATGPVVGGIVGRERQAFAIHGDTLNRARRLQALNVELQSRVLLDSDTASGLSPETDLRKIGAVELRGREASVAIFGV